MNVEERFGRAIAALEDERERHVQTIGILRALKRGEITVDQLTVGDDNSWAVTPVGIRVVIEEPEGDFDGVPGPSIGASEAAQLAEAYLKAQPID